MKSIRYTEATEENVKDAQCLIINCFGLLSSIYRYGEVAYVGGGFGVGIHNVPEAAVYSIPVIIGPNNKRFQEAQHLLKIGGCFEITDSASFLSIIGKLLDDEAFCADAGTLKLNALAIITVRIKMRFIVLLGFIINFLLNGRKMFRPYYYQL